MAAAADPGSGPVLDVQRFPPLNRAVRILGLVLKFVRLLVSFCCCRRKVGVGVVLSDSEMREAQSCVIRLTQSQAYPEEYGALSRGKVPPRSSQIASLRLFWTSLVVACS